MILQFNLLHRKLHPIKNKIYNLMDTNAETNAVLTYGYQKNDYYHHRRRRRLCST